jgi:hypothetical protein
MKIAIPALKGKKASRGQSPKKRDGLKSSGLSQYRATAKMRQRTSTLKKLNNKRL